MAVPACRRHYPGDTGRQTGSAENVDNDPSRGSRPRVTARHPAEVGPEASGPCTQPTGPAARPGPPCRAPTARQASSAQARGCACS